MFEKVNPSHPDKVADRIAGALVDLSYGKWKNPRVAIEVLIGHDKCYIINETNCHLSLEEVIKVVDRIVGYSIHVEYNEFPQDEHLAENQKTLHCGDNGIFKGVPITKEQRALTKIVKNIYKIVPYDGKYIINGKDIIACQSNCKILTIPNYNVKLNPLGYWTGGINVDSGATNRKLGSDMGDSVTGGGLHGKSYCKADVSVNIYAWLLAQQTNQVVKCYCAIGDTNVRVQLGHKKDKLVSYSSIVEIAKAYINEIGGFEKFAEWGLIR